MCAACVFAAFVVVLVCAATAAVTFEWVNANRLADQSRGGFTLPIDYPFDGEEP